MFSKTNFIMLLLAAIIMYLKFNPSIEVMIVQLLNNLFFDNQILAFVTEIGNAFFITAFLIPALVIYSRIDPGINDVPISMMVVPSLIFGLFIQSIKNIFNLPRPGGVEDINIDFLDPVFQSGAFPSGHAASIFIIIFIWLNIALKDTKKHKVLKLSFFLFAIIVGLTRVIVGAHWLSDIIGSFLFAWLFTEYVLKYFYGFAKAKLANYASWLIVVFAWYGVFFIEVFDYI